MKWKMMSSIRNVYNVFIGGNLLGCIRAKVGNGDEEKWKKNM
jgi:hypothetical protein